MNSLLILFFLSLVIGGLPTWVPDKGKAAWRHFADTGQGLSKALVVFILAKYLIGTPVSLAVTGVGLTLGQTWFSRRGFFRYRIRLMAIAFLMLIVPEVAALSIVLWLFLRLFLSRWSNLVVAGMLPLITWSVGKTDIYVILAGFMGTLGIYLDFALLEKAWGTLAKKLGLRRSRSRAGASGLRRRKILSRILVFMLIAILATGIFLNKYVYRGFGMQVDVFRKGTEDFKLVALTFDDGPDPLYTPGILDILSKRGIKGTFFLVGRHAEDYPEIARRIVQEGHEIGNHTYSHYNLLNAPPGRIEKEIVKGEEAIARATGERPALFRPPRGLFDANTQQVLRERGYNLILWSLSSQDWLEISTRNIANNILSRVGPGDVLLFHDSGNLVRSSGGSRLNTVAALPIIIDELEKEGYTFVTVTEMMIVSGLTGGE